ncbi:MAG: hypothetical protein HY726_22215 [Candidatus Rokubacteria bacterium]|nr:hypothetical protein [Candidatus Rokubacteria bacterium]
MAKLPPSRVSPARVLEQLRLAARKGDRAALVLALDQMRTLAYSPRHWEKYLRLLANPLARLADLLVIKQGEKIARQKGWVKPKRAARRGGAKGRAGKAAPAPPRPRRKRLPSDDLQPSLFPELS